MKSHISTNKITKKHSKQRKKINKKSKPKPPKKKKREREKKKNRHFQGCEF
jgi:hypothetical protein